MRATRLHLPPPAQRGLHPVRGRSTVLPYLQDLGVDWVYLSPILEAEAGSDHGYDVVRHDRVDPARAAPRAWPPFATAAHERGMGVLVDIVPNHVGVATPARAPGGGTSCSTDAAPAARRHFDIDWDAGGGRLLLPVLGETSSRLGPWPTGSLRYDDLRLPLAPGTSTPATSSTTSSSLAPRRRQPELPPLLRGQGARGRARRGPARSSRTPTSRSAAGSTRASSTACASTIPTACATRRGYLDRLAELTCGAYVLVEKILEPGEELPTSWATARHHRLRRAGTDRVAPTRLASAPRVGARGPSSRRPGARQQAGHRLRHCCPRPVASCATRR